jgi:hypothetical protein
MDPPYINTCNDNYNNADLNIYEYIYNNDIKKYKSSIICCLENIWMIKLLFKNNNISDPYDKQYQGSKKNTTHIIITK